MRHLRLRIQLAIVFLFLGIYSVAVGLSYMIQSNAQTALERSFHEDLAVLTKLPRLADELRHLDLLTNQYLLTGNPAWLHERRRMIGEIRARQAELTGLLSGAKEERIWRDLDGQLASYLSQEEHWIGRKEAGRLSMANAGKLEIGSRSYDQIIDLIVAMRDANFRELQKRRESARRAARLTFYLTLATGFAVGALLILFLSWYVISPITALESYARNWQLGHEWDLEPAASGPEIQSLFQCLGDMAQRLNREFIKEQELARFKSQLVSLVSHEFNNALSVINGVSLLLEDTEGQAKPERRESYYQMLKSNVRALHIAANNLLNMGRLETGKFAISPRRTMLREILQQTIQRLEILSLRKGIRVSLEVPENPLPVRADPEALSMVATNLLSNAIKYTPDGGAITVRVAPDSGRARMVRVSFKDTGIGIAPEEQKRIFSGYYRTERGKNAAKGFGLGLSLAKRIIEAHDSSLEVESQPGKGAVFSFDLPIDDADGPAGGAEPTR